MGFCEFERQHIREPGHSMEIYVSASFSARGRSGGVRHYWLSFGDAEPWAFHMFGMLSFFLCHRVEPANCTYNLSP